MNHVTEQGRLVSLGAIPDKYDVAITTACGSLNNMVVDKVQQGQACIEYLHEQNVGHVNFILEKIDKTNDIRTIQTPENVPRLFDLVKPKEPRFAHALNRELRDTLVSIVPVSTSTTFAALHLLRHFKARLGEDSYDGLGDALQEGRDELMRHLMELAKLMSLLCLV